MALAVTANRSYPIVDDAPTSYLDTVIIPGLATLANMLDTDVAALITSVAGKQASNAVLTSISAINTAGLIAQNGSGTAVARSIAVGSGMSVSNADGSAGNPTISLDSRLSDIVATGITLAMMASNVADTDATLAANSNSRFPTQAAIKSYVDNLVTGLAWKAAVRAATTANITLSGAQTIDGVSVVAGDRVLVKNQSTASQNGIYIAAAGAWSRAGDADAGAELVNATVLVAEGTTNADTQWTCTNNATPTIGSTSITFAQMGGAGTYTATGGVVLTGNQFSADTGTSGHKLPYLDAANTWGNTQTFAQGYGVNFANSGATHGIFDYNNTTLIMAHNTSDWKTSVRLLTSAMQLYANNGLVSWDGQTFVAGDGSVKSFLAVNGSNSGTAGGASINLQNGSVTKLAIGNYSAIIGGAYDDTILFYGTTDYEFRAGGSNVWLRVDSAGNPTFPLGAAFNYITTITTVDQSTNRLRFTNTGSGGRSYDIVGGRHGVNNSDFSVFDVTAGLTRFFIDSGGVAYFNGNIKWGTSYQGTLTYSGSDAYIDTTGLLYLRAPSGVIIQRITSSANPATTGSSLADIFLRLSATNVGSGGYGLDFGVGNADGSVWLQARDHSNYANFTTLRLNAAGGAVSIGQPSLGLLIQNSATDYLHTIDKDGTGVSFSTNSGSRGFRWVVNGNNMFGMIPGTGVTVYNGNAFYPDVDNSSTLGTGSKRWSVVYAATGTINTSDMREKTVFDPANDNDYAFAREVFSGAGWFQWLEAIKQKGKTKARKHFGLGAQNVEAAAEKHSLNPERLAMFCEDDVVETDKPKKGDKAPPKSRVIGTRKGLRPDQLHTLGIATLFREVEALRAELNELRKAA